MAVQGVFASNRQIVGNRMGDFASSILNIFPQGTAPLLALSSGMRSEMAQDTVVNWFEETKIQQRAQVATAEPSTTATSIQVDDGTSFVEGVILYNEDTNEYLLVTDSSGINPTTLTVERAFAGSTAAAMLTTHHLTRVGSAYEEGSDIPDAVVNQGLHRTNYTQIFRTAWSVTGTLKAIRFHTGDQVAKNRADAMFFHAEDMERAMWWGRKFVSQRNGKPFHGMDGLVTQMQAYNAIQENVSAGVSSRSFREFQRRIFRFNIKGEPNERMAFCGDIALRTLTEAAGRDGDHNITSMETDFGLKFTRFHSVFGMLNLMTHPLFVENPVWQDVLYVLHPGGIKKRMLRATKQEGYDKNGLRIQGRDQDEGVITTEMAIQCGAPETMGIMTNITTDVASYT